MELWLKILIIVLSSIVGSGIVFSIFCMFFISHKIYNSVLVRTNKEKWSRQCSAPEDAQIVEMWEAGLEWGKANREYMKAVQIKSFDGLKLVGEYFDFGNERTVLIVQGRSECCKYSYFYAIPYKEAGYNVLVIDTRAHGMSDGKYNTAGIKESKDLIAWANFLHDEKNQSSVSMHAICVGGCSVVMAVTDPECPNFIDKIVLDGVFTNFVESFATHMKDQGHGKSPIFWCIWFWFRIHAGASVSKCAPLKLVDKIDKPILFLYGREDKYSLPAKSQILFDKCGSKYKQIEWFDHGAHSRLRVTNPEQYDRAVKNFAK